MWCVQVPTGAFVARRNGQIFITGNSGFPKSHDISKAIDKKLGAEREVIGIKKHSTNFNNAINNRTGYLQDEANRNNKKCFGYGEESLTIPATDEAKQWDGWGTALKPANEPIVVARKPLSEKTVAENVLKWGTGGLNIDGCRVEYQENDRLLKGGSYVGNRLGSFGDSIFGTGGTELKYGELPQGRFPANVILDEEAGRMLDEQSGSISYGNKPGGYSYSDRQYAVQGFVKDCKPKAPSNYGDSGGASRFFYCAKASKKERGEGNNHPTVKPVKLIEYLITLVTPPDGVCLDPFMGSGTTAIACININRNYIGFELDPTYCAIAEERIKKAKQNKLF
jgi:site-specific DNA-methyltransferase (adenine-specific)